MNSKQVIVVRKFPNLRTGKYCSQVAHASMAFLTKGGRMKNHTEYGEMGADYHECYFENSELEMEKYFNEINHWLKNSFRKICVYVNSEQELKDLHQKALEKGLISHLIEDNGATEFNGVKTLTCLAIGPHWDEKFEGLTDHLPLL